MRVQPVSQEVADAGGFGEPFKPGEYDFVIAAAEETQSAARNDMLKLTLHVFTPTGEKRTVFDYILSSESGAWKARHMMDSIGLIQRYEQGAIEPHEIEGRPGRCKLGIEPANATYSAKNKIVDYLGLAKNSAAPRPAAQSRPAAQPARQPAMASTARDLDDDIPF